MATLAPPPVNDPVGSFIWLEWYRQLRDYLVTASSVPWNVIDFTGSNITSIALRAHNDLQGISGGSPNNFWHLTQTQHTDLTDGGTTILHSHDFVFKTPASLTLNTGTGTGSVTDVQTMFDGNVYNIAEAASTPGFDVEFNFTSVTKIRGVQVRLDYNGSATHNVQIALRNYNTSAWDVMFFTADTLDFNTFYALLPSNTNYIDGSNNSKIRIYHASAGDAAHDIDIDYVSLIT